MNALRFTGIIPLSFVIGFSTSTAMAECGIASNYSSGKVTANGERFNPNGLSAAHKRLPFGAKVAVINRRTGRSIVVRINDRGPFAQNRIIDMSRRGAQLLGFYGPGTAHVRVEIDAEESRQLAIALTGTDYPNGSMVASRQPSQPIDSDSTPVALAGASSLTPATEAPLVAAAAIEDTPAAMAPPPAALHVGQTSLAYQPYQPQPQWSPAVPDHPAAGELAMADTPPVESVALASTAVWAAPLPMDPHPAAMPARAPAESAYPRPVRPLPAPTVASQRAYVQAGAFASADNAQRVRDRLARLGPVAVDNRSAAGSPLYRVRLGPLPSVGEAERMLPTVIQAGFPGSQVVVE